MAEIRSLTIASRVFGEDRTAQVFLPPGYDSCNQYPTVYCHYAHLYFNLTQTPQWLEEQIAAGMEPCLLVGIPIGNADEELDLYRFVAQELVPAVEREFAAAPNRADRWLLGYSGGAGHMVEMGMHYGNMFAKVAAQAPGWMVWDREERRIASCYLDESLANIGEREQVPLPEFWFVWGDTEEEVFEQEARKVGARMIAFLRERYGARVEQTLVPGGHGPAGLKAGLPKAFAFLHRRA